MFVATLVPILRSWRLAREMHAGAALTTGARSVMALTLVIAASGVNGEYAKCSREEDGCNQRHEAADYRSVNVHRSRSRLLTTVILCPAGPHRTTVAQLGNDQDVVAFPPPAGTGHAFRLGEPSDVLAFQVWARVALRHARGRPLAMGRGRGRSPGTPGLATAPAVLGVYRTEATAKTYRTSSHPSLWTSCSVWEGCRGLGPLPSRRHRCRARHPLDQRETQGPLRWRC